MKAFYNPPEEAGEDASITFGLGEESDETFSLRRGEEYEVPVEFEEAMLAHPDIDVTD